MMSEQKDSEYKLLKIKLDVMESILINLEDMSVIIDKSPLGEESKELFYRFKRDSYKRRQEIANEMSSIQKKIRRNLRKNLKSNLISKIE